jgi:hypothetical protein
LGRLFSNHVVLDDHSKSQYQEKAEEILAGDDFSLKHTVRNSLVKFADTCPDSCRPSV